MCVTVFIAHSEMSTAWKTWADDEQISFAKVVDLSLWNPMWVVLIIYPLAEAVQLFIRH